MKQLFSFVMFLALAFAGHAQPITSNQIYRVIPEFPKYVTAHMEFRDASGARWPSIFYGRPVTNGLVRLGPAQPAAAFTLNCSERPQKNGDQSRRVLGELFADAKPGGVILQINGMGPITSVVDKKAPMSSTFTGFLNVAGTKVPVNAVGALRQQSAGRGDEKNESLMIDLEFEIKAGDLGLKTFDASAPLQVRAALTAYSDAAVAAAAARRR